MKIAIGAGHGGFGVTPGKRSPDGSLYEWEFNAAVVSKLIAKLKTCENVSILRLDDPTGKTDVPLKTRTDKANAWGADVYYSQHANAFGSDWNSARGIETFTYTSRPAEAVAFANIVQSHVAKVTGLPNRGVKAADLHVLRESNMTAILNEGPFMTNKEDAALLKSNTFREAYAEAVFQAFVAFFKLKRKPEPSTKPPTPTKPKPKTKRVYLPASDSSWRVYPTNKAPVKGNEKGYLNPKKFGGLDYEILGNPQKDVYTIQTSDFGKVNIYAAPSTGAIIK